MKIPPKAVEKFARWLFKHPALMNTLSKLKMKLMPQEKWGIDNLMYITKTDTPVDLLPEAEFKQRINFLVKSFKENQKIVEAYY